MKCLTVFLLNMTISFTLLCEKVPSSSADCRDLQAKALAEANFIIIMGDFNINLVNDDCMRSKSSFPRSNGMYKPIRENTRVTDTSTLSLIMHMSLILVILYK